jgi:plasmid stabilization system protein ParE
MNRYTVVWTPSAEASLTAIWLSSRHRSQLSEAALRIESLLADAPAGLGESRSAGVRVLLQDPLGIEFSVSEADRRVDVISVWCWR